MTMGIGLIALGVVALAAPFAVGTWSLQFLGLPMLAVGAADLYTTVSSPALRARPAAYATCFVATTGALVLYLSPSLVASGVMALLLILLVLDGALKVGRTVFGPPSGTPRTVMAVNAVWSILLALAGLWLWRRMGFQTAIGVSVAGFSAIAGWGMLMSPVRRPETTATAAAHDLHPDAKLSLGRHELFGAAIANRAASAPAVARIELYWLLVAGLVLFATHLGRMQSGDTWLGLVSPFVATAGDALMAILLGILFVLPLRLFWRRLARPIERWAWRLRLSGHDARLQALPRRLVREWTDARLSFSTSLREGRASLPSAAGVAVRLGLPLAVLFVTINSIWGFTWYFNTESWASAVYQKMTELRVDIWRASMVDAIAAAYGGDAPGLFQVAPPGITDGDFSFIVIGDTGEGDASQYALVNSYQQTAREDLVKFMVISSDVIYPAGAMSDYENNFYLPFKGFTKPLYAIPGNHDWFDALEGFNANFLEPRAAAAALAARADADLDLTNTDSNRIKRLLSRAERLRELYGIQNARQRAPFFEIETKDFALVAIDTGILRTIDERQLAWLKAALERAKGKFIMAILGHPKYAGGADTSLGDAAFADLQARLVQAGANVMMAGDTHDFEYYVEYAGEKPRPVYHFVNGGGGAYLSLGSSLAWPDAPSTMTWAFYPSPEAVYNKLDAETPVWKRPFWAWIKRFGGWPVSTETLSGIFDLNQAPFYQSFIEVRVERSRQRVVFALNGVNGPIRWRDLHSSFAVQAGNLPDASVEFMVNLKSSRASPS